MVSCDDVITLQQFGGTCWFNALLTAMLYSDESRKLLLQKSRTWDLSIPVFETLAFIIRNKYFRTGNNYDDYLYFKFVMPENILLELNEYNPKKFIFNPVKNREGYHSHLYIRKLYKLLGVNVLYLDYDTINDKYYYSLFNNLIIEREKKALIYKEVKYKDRTVIDELINNHDILIINVLSVKNIENNKNKTGKFIYPPHYLITDKIKNETDTITFKNQKYNQDSVMIGNSNTKDPLHSIVGIKCMGVKHVYNGWTRQTIDPSLGKQIIEDDGKIEVPCEYMRFEWKTDEKNEFMIDPFTCTLVDKYKKLPIKKLVFSFNSVNRLMIYTKIIEKSPPIVVPVVPVVAPVFIDVVIPNASPDGMSIGAVSTLQAVIRRKLADKVPSDEAKTLQAVIRRKLADKVPTDASKTLQAIIRRRIIKKPEPLKPKPAPKPAGKTKICAEGSTLNPETNRCNKNCTPIQEKSINTGRCIKKCTDKQARNVETNRCKKIPKVK